MPTHHPHAPTTLPTRTALAHRRTNPGDPGPRDLPRDVPGALHGASDVGTVATRTPCPLARQGISPSP